MIENSLTFTANCVEVKTDHVAYDEYNISSASISSIYFGERDPGQDGDAWTFYQGGGEGYGTRMMRGRQQRVWEGIKEVVVSRSRLECVFTETGIAETGFNTLIILYEISEERWQILASMARRVFGTIHFKLID